MPQKRVAPPRTTARYLLCLLLQLVSLPAFANYRVELSAPDSIRDLLATHLDLMRYRDREDIHADQLDFMVATAPDQVRDLAATEGFFSTTTDVKLDKDGPVPLVRIAVNAGPPTTVSGTDIEVSGPAREQSPAQVREVIQSWTMRPGAPFRQRDWAAAKDTGLRLLQERRYPAAGIADSHAAIYADRQQAELAVTYESGPLFTLGRLEITGTDRYPESIIRNVNPLQEGEQYDVQRLLALQRAIQRTPYFSNSIVTIDKDPANAAGVPVEVKVTEYRTQRLRAGAGYATDTGARVEGRYSHNNVFGRAWVFDSQVRIEQRRQTGTVELAMPPDGTAYVNSVHASTERTTLEGIDLLSRRLGARRARSTDTDDYAYTIEYYRDRLDQLSDAIPSSDIVTAEGSHQALVAGYARTHRKVDDPLFPRKGYIASVEAGVALKGMLTDQTFFRTYGRLRRYWPVGERDLVLLRSELGAVISKPGNAAIPASLLFRAGGTDSVRGYDFQSIGNVRNGVVFPTRYLATAGLEYQHWLSASWGGAVFYDVGTATDNWGEKQLFQGVGVGARWRSPVGPVNVDLAYGIRNRNISPHFSLGVAF
jgi:translocation and assembly module TamA